MADTRLRVWLVESRPAMDAWNAHAVEHGLPLDAFRQF
jgi:post-segregation antitoxin (ccd killing protein)